MAPQGSLQRELAPWVPPHIQQRGKHYQRDGRVTIRRATSSILEATVRGSRPYLVLLNREEQQLVFGCACPYAVDGAICKHVWALAVEADQRKQAAEFVDGLGRDKPMFISDTTAELDDDELDDDEFDDDEFDDDEFRNARIDPDELFASLSRWRDGHSASLVADAAARTAFDSGRSYWASRSGLERWQQLVTQRRHPASDALGAGHSETWYLIDLLHPSGASRFWGKPTLTLYTAQRRRLRGGGLGRPTHLGKPPEGLAPDGVEQIVWSLARNSPDGSVVLAHDLSRQVLPTLCQRGRLGAFRPRLREPVIQLKWDSSAPWRVVLELVPVPGDDDHMSIGAHLERETPNGKEQLSLERAHALLPLGLVIVGEQLAELAPGHAAWLEELCDEPLVVARSELPQLATPLLAVAGAPRFQSLEGFELTEHHAPLEPRLRLSLPKKNAKRIRGMLTFGYGAHQVGADTEPIVEGNTVYARDFEAESSCVQTLRSLGVSVERPPAIKHPSRPPVPVSFDAVELASLAGELLERGFRIDVEGKPYRRATGAWHPIIECDQDWFDVKGSVEFDGQKLELPQLLRAIGKKQRWVRLEDGGIGAIPEEWLESLDVLAQLAPPRGRRLRFHAVQAGLLESALSKTARASAPALEAMKRRFEGFDRISSKREPRTFRGELRGYQRLALGWLESLDELGFGGCLADDMGLGKTIIVLAWLLRRRAQRRRSPSDARRVAGRSSLRATGRSANAKHSPSLLVVPKSLLFNWQREAERFAPSLKLLVHHGTDRRAPGGHFADYDVVLTSYGTLRRDAEPLCRLDFDYVVLDEAHSIKNTWTNAHQAASSLNGRRRLALTGTPLENHLGELWNLLSFLNPEIFQGLAHLRKTFERPRPTETALEQVILRSLNPFILRRTKAEVARDLPERVEKTLRVRLSKQERQLYDGLAEFYRQRILHRRQLKKDIGGRGHRRSNEGAQQTAEALEALLRLRQAACHPGLVDEQHTDTSSSKLELLVGQLAALRAEGHKALVFSQFTKLLGLLAARLEQAELPHAYLDGKTRDREGEVERFQRDPNLSVFLISLKAGGVGLNLVAADYVFLLDPWWNPASEAQAIDRAHRIGQTRKVIAYRLLSENTVEEKVAALQDEKRELAEALFGDTDNFSAKFTREDLELLLGG